jgi:hypothetical protein
MGSIKMLIPPLVQCSHSHNTFIAGSLDRGYIQRLVKLDRTNELMDVPTLVKDMVVSSASY